MIPDSRRYVPTVVYRDHKYLSRNRTHPRRYRDRRKGSGKRSQKPGSAPSRGRAGPYM